MQRYWKSNVSGERTIAPLFTWRSAIADSDLPPATRHVLLALSLYMNERGGSAYPGSKRLAGDTGLHVETVKTHLRDAARLGWVGIVSKGGSPKDGVRHATEYVARTPLVLADDDRKSSTSSTGSPEWSDRKSSVEGLEAQDFPNTSVNTSLSSEDWLTRLDNDAPPVSSFDRTAPWKDAGLTFEEWRKSQEAASG